MISQWETVLRERGLGKFETRRVVTLTFKSRIYRKSGVLQETDKERLLLSYQANQAVVAGKFPLTRELALELAALMAQVRFYLLSRLQKDNAVGFLSAEKSLLELLFSLPIPFKHSYSTYIFKNSCMGRFVWYVHTHNIYAVQFFHSIVW